MTNIYMRGGHRDRDLILDAHKAKMDELRKRQEVDKERQMQALEQRLAVRREKRLKGELAALAAKEIALLNDPLSHTEALCVSIQVLSLLASLVQKYAY
jgi:hypothetical protein